jgi:hypothetical protein
MKIKKGILVLSMVTGIVCSLHAQDNTVTEQAQANTSSNSGTDGSAVGVPHFSIFADARYLAAVKTSNYGFARLGVRISF